MKAGAQALLLLVACSPSPPNLYPGWTDGLAAESSTGTPESTSTATTGDLEGETVAFEVWVRRSSTDRNPMPAAGVTVAFDTPSGRRIERRTDADGRVVFEGIDWSAGRAAVTAHLPGHDVYSVLGLTRDRVEELTQAGALRGIVLTPLSPPPDDGVEVFGNALNMEDPDENTLLVGASIGGGYYEDPGPAWSLRVPEATPFTLVATEWHSGTPQVPREFEQFFYGWTRVDHPAISEDTEVLIDFAERLTPQTVTGSVVFPDYATTDFFDGARVYAQVTSTEADGVLGLGFLTKVDYTPDQTRFEYDLEHVTLDVIEQPYWLMELYDDFRRTMVRTMGYPVGGQLPAPLEPPELVASSSWNAPLRWRLNPIDAEREGLTLQLRMMGSYDAVAQDLLATQGRWTLVVPAAATSVTAPELPTSADPNEIFGTDSLVGLRVFACVDVQTDPVGCELFSYSDLYPVLR